MLFKNLVLGIHFVQFVGDGATYDIRQNLFNCLFVRVFVSLTIVFVSFVASFLTHLPNLLIDSLDNYAFYLPNRQAINGLLILRLVASRLLKTIFELFLFVIAGHLCLVESCFEPFVLALAHMRIGNRKGSGSLKQFVLNALNFVLLHFLRYGRAQVLWLIHSLVLSLL